MSKEIQDWMKQWLDLVNKEETNSDDFWIQTPIGEFKNPKFKSNENGGVGEININIQYDEWKKKKYDTKSQNTTIKK